ncbi:FtsQ-type POTRA domain-containing protein [Streptomyces sp. MUM 203J]|uniref:cell division protein FtsQ/DivIB n=1 Tax=Streptomyces sp. MUM 203J TaxID=2791990 RepID=UPI001F03C073|nr:FtsQ-type POTRA domain-containing protein [Streptomyces sp. MUM 203J]MCH0539947.1 FtsQ-type POTRA domain-containing protein [Streptomyces sp. MUM 203J]
MAGPTTTERGASKPSAGTSSGRSGSRGPGRARGSRGSGEAGPEDRRTRSRLRLILLGSALLALAGGVLWALYGSSWLRAENVTVSGTRVLTPRQVEQVAAVPVGSPLASVDTGAIEERLRRELPRIDSVDVVRSWPGTISLEVAERVPVLVVEQGGEYTEVDAGAVRFATSVTAPRDVPLLRLDTGDSPGRRRFGGGRLTAEAVRVVTGLPAGLARQVTSVRVRSYDSVTLELAGDRTVFWGSAGQGEAKERALVALMKAAPKAGHFDVSAPSAPAASRS